MMSRLGFFLASVVVPLAFAANVALAETDIIKIDGSSTVYP
jgi:ABC-type phosphate transport system substrate-binding protein